MLEKSKQKYTSHTTVSHEQRYVDATYLKIIAKIDRKEIGKMLTAYQGSSCFQDKSTTNGWI